MLSPRQLRRLDRKIKAEIMGKMKEDLMYLIKPRKKYIPRFVWRWLLKNILNLNLNNLKKIK